MPLFRLTSGNLHDDSIQNFQINSVGGMIPRNKTLKPQVEVSQSNVTKLHL